MKHDTMFVAILMIVLSLLGVLAFNMNARQDCAARGGRVEPVVGGGWVCMEGRP
jgi:hypothetical protein